MLILTDNGVFDFPDPAAGRAPDMLDFGTDARQIALSENLSAIAADDGTVVFHRNGDRWTVATGIDEPIESLLILDPSGPEMLIGTEGAHLHRLVGDAVTRIGSFDALDCRTGWHTPWGGPPAVRTLAAAPDGWVYADIHVGSIMRSADRGETWQPVTGDLHEDVHQVATCPSAPDRVYANTAAAVYVSGDRGQSWRDCGRPLDNRYGRAIAVAPENPDLLLATVSDGPHGEDVHGGLYRSDDCGRSWSHVTDGFPASTPENINTARVAWIAGSVGWAATGETLYVGRERANRWEPHWKASSRIRVIDAGTVPVR